MNPEPDTAFEISLRPPMFSEFTGQGKVRERLELMVEAATKRGDVLEHILLSGPPGLGKTTLAYIIANAMGVNIKNTSGPVIEKAGELAGLLTSLEKGDVLFIDEIDRGISLSGDGGLSARHHQRSGTTSAKSPPESAKVHFGRRDNPGGNGQFATAFPFRHDRAARLLRRRRDAKDHH